MITCSSGAVTETEYTDDQCSTNSTSTTYPTTCAAGDYGSTGTIYICSTSAISPPTFAPTAAPTAPTVAPTVAAPTATNSSIKKNHTGAIVGAVLGVLFAGLFGFLFYHFYLAKVLNASASALNPANSSTTTSTGEANNPMAHRINM